MKLRIHHQEVRFRLSERDLEKLETSKTLNENLTLSNEVSWTYRLSLKGDVTQIHSTPKSLEISLPDLDFTNWLRGHEIEWSFVQQNPKLTILIEKDLKP